MKTAKLFVNGRSQAVRLPKECRLPGTEVYVKKFGGMIILFPKRNPWSVLVKSLDRFSDDFMTDRAQPSQRTRMPL